MTLLSLQCCSVISAVILTYSVLAFADPDPEPEAFAPIGTRILEAVSGFLGYGNRYQSCNTPCPPWRCEDDSAIIHGTCCGCSNWLNPYSWSISCVNDLQCPNPYTSPLCSDFQWMLRCCCS
ncbi:unnamed protein product [Bemisia tabaci]|uniref:Secreted protein n=1 Tax=Bemisia tabaci TaxID=7038 RepID=A0A9P0EWI0_BEMTA|nr:unnamed protein product [Bemisia tabaci]